MDKIIGEALTFDDVLIVPRKSSVKPMDVDLRTRLSRNVYLNIPIISAVMDTVTDSKMCIALALEGGAGTLHRNYSNIEDRVREIEKTKFFTNKIITTPIKISPDFTLEQLEIMKRREGYTFSRFPVVNGKKLVGIISGDDYLFETNLNQRVSKFMTGMEGMSVIKEKDILVNSKYDMDKAWELFRSSYRKSKKKTMPVVNSSGELIGILCLKDIMMVKQFPNANKDEYGKLIVGAGVGVSEKEIEAAYELARKGVDYLVVDCSHGHADDVAHQIKRLKEMRKEKGLDFDIIAGNGVTSECAYDIIKAGADAIKVGVGPGSICTTRIVSGCGMPQITATLNMYFTAKKYGIPIITDGGIRYSGDIVKSFVAGADSVMLGNMLAGLEETPREPTLLEGKSYKDYRGMGSISAMKEKNVRDRYHQNDDAYDTNKLVAEGVEGLVPYKGKLADYIFQIIGGVRAGMGLAGCKDIRELHRYAQFVKITQAGMKESHPHDIIITKDSPNYRRE